MSARCITESCPAFGQMVRPDACVCAQRRLGHGGWWRDLAEVFALVDWMIARHRIDTAAEAQKVHREPWLYAKAYNDMCAEQTRERRLRVA